MTHNTPIEQAIFTSLGGSRASGYQLAGASEGLSSAEQLELTTTAPAHDSLWTDAQPPRAVSFHALASGRFALSLTTLAGAEYSGRGACVTTRYLVCDAAAFERFGRQPLRLFKAALAAGHWDAPLGEAPPRAIQLPGRAPEVDREALRRTRGPADIAALCALLHALENHARVGVVERAARFSILLAALGSLLPPTERAGASFSTGWRPATNRPLRLTRLPVDAGPPRLSHGPCRLHEVRLSEINGSAASASRYTPGSWPARVHALLSAGAHDELAREMAADRAASHQAAAKSADAGV